MHFAANMLLSVVVLPLQAYRCKLAQFSIITGLFNMLRDKSLTATRAIPQLSSLAYGNRGSFVSGVAHSCASAMLPDSCKQTRNPQQRRQCAVALNMVLLSTKHTCVPFCSSSSPVRRYLLLEFSIDLCSRYFLPNLSPLYAMRLKSACKRG